MSARVVTARRDALALIVHPRGDLCVLAVVVTRTATTTTARIHQMNVDDALRSIRVAYAIAYRIAN